MIGVIGDIMFSIIVVLCMLLIVVWVGCVVILSTAIMVLATNIINKDKIV